MNRINYDKRLFVVDGYGNLYPKTKNGLKKTLKQLKNRDLTLEEVLEWLEKSSVIPK